MTRGKHNVTASVEIGAGIYTVSMSGRAGRLLPARRIGPKMAA